jgi:hypothetical protein
MTYFSVGWAKSLARTVDILPNHEAILPTRTSLQALAGGHAWANAREIMFASNAMQARLPTLRS